VKEQNEDGARKRYDKPQLHRVELTPEEMFVAACKTVLTSAPAGATCEVNGCFADGS